jgi:segregation and condensation protein B
MATAEWRPWSAVWADDDRPALSRGGWAVVSDEAAPSWSPSPAGPAAGPPPRDEDSARLEAVLLLCREPVSSRKLAQLAALADGTKARTLVRTLNRRYDTEGSAFRVEEVAGGFQLLTRKKFAPWLRRLHAQPVEVRLSSPALETLAVVAYRQPVLRAEIEAIRGVQCDEVLRQLMDRDLVRVTGRSEELGRPLLYGTTRRFLQVFGLRHLEELPRADALRQPRLCESGTPADTLNSSPLKGSPVAEEEIIVKTLVKHNLTEEELAARAQTTVVLPARNEKDDDFDDEDEMEDDDDFEDDDDLDDDEDEDFDDEEDEDTWEEVEDDDDLEEEEDEDWDDDEDEDWDDDDDDDWDEDEDEEEDLDDDEE